MDNDLIRELFNNVIEAGELLGLDAAFRTNLATLRDRLPPDQIGRLGQLQEWLEDVDAPNNNHRHMSPLFALYPGDEITPASSNLFAAAKVLLKWRGDGSTGWSYAWRMPLWARAGDGDFAFRQFSALLQRRTLPNLFDLCGPFQIDGNLGAPAGVAELLLQSHRTVVRSPKSEVQSPKSEVQSPETEVRILDLLPALPQAWPKGSVTGLCARGGFEVDLAWDNGALAKAVIRSKLGNPCQVRCGDRQCELATARGGQYTLDGQLKVTR
jgi:alpha-L-fucosidase 2